MPQKIRDLKNHIHFITFSCYKRRKLLDHDRANGIVVYFLSEQLKQSGRSLNRVRGHAGPYPCPGSIYRYWKAECLHEPVEEKIVHADKEADERSPAQICQNLQLDRPCVVGQILQLQCC